MRAFFILFSLMLVSCENIEHRTVGTVQVQRSITLFAVDRSIILNFSDDKKVSQIEKIVSEKQIMMKKLLPVFDMTLVIKNGTDLQEWQFARPNYLKSATGGKVFVSKNNLDIFSLLEQLSDK